MIVADLHVHTRNSDGTLALEAVPAIASRAGLDAVAITDHDRLHPSLDGPVGIRDDVTIIHGIELRVEASVGPIDLLGYGVEPTSELQRELDRLQRDRIERGRAMIERVEGHLGVDLDIEVREGIGRPHIARAITAHPDTDYDVDGAFEQLIGDGRPCYVARDIPSVSRGVALLKEACSIVGLAHPLRYADPAAAIDAARGIDAIERWYPYDTDVDTEPVERAIAQEGLLPTGGSDAHDDQLGRAGLTADAYHAVRTHLPTPT